MWWTFVTRWQTHPQLFLSAETSIQPAAVCGHPADLITVTSRPLWRHSKGNTYQLLHERLKQKRAIVYQISTDYPTGYFVKFLSLYPAQNGSYQLSVARKCTEIKMETISTPYCRRVVETQIYCWSYLKFWRAFIPSEEIICKCHKLYDSLLLSS